MIVEFRLDELQPAPWGVTHMTAAERRALTLSLVEDGLIYPLIIRGEDRMIVDGFQRWDAMRNSEAFKSKVGNGTIHALVVGGSDEQMMLLHLKLNCLRGAIIAARLGHLVESCKGLQLGDRLGLKKETLEALANPDSFLLEGLTDHKYSAAWYPK